MFSGTDGDRNYPTQWALNPSAYQNVSNDQVDWAALAQQWIMMKETCPPEQVPPAPPPPPIGPVKKDKENSSNAGSSLIEGGEAPMEVENEKDDAEAIIDPSIPPASWTGPASGPGSWGWQQQQWGWNTGWTAPPAVPGATPAAAIPPLALTKNALLPTPFTFPATDATASNYPGYASGYWTSGQSNRMKGNKKHRGGESDDEPESTTVTLDAAKRRQLPAWIREGLEKMEREKQKQLDKEREAREREEFLKRKKQEEEEVRKVMTDSGMVTLPSKSKFESDSEDSGKEDRIKPSFKRETSPPKRIMKKRESTEMESPPIRSKSKEERIQDVMLTVRRMMTEILLDVTTEEIENICQEELKRYRASASAMNPQKTPALASLTGKLGLGIYGESGSSGSESEHSDANDSDSNLKETIRRRKAEFMRTEREIDAHALDMERRQLEHERLQREHEQSGNNNSSGGGNPSGSNNAKDGERYSQVDTANSHYGHSEKPTPRKSRFHDGPINENTQLPKTDDYTYAGGSGTSTGNSKSINKNNTVSNSNSKSASRKRDKSSSSRSRTSSESKSDSSSESDSSGSRHHRHRSHRHHHGERNRRRSVSERRNSKRDSRSRSDSFDSRAGKVFKDPSTESKKERRNSKNGNSEDRRYSSPEYSRSKSTRNKRSYSRDRSSRSHRRSRSRDRRSKTRSRSRDRYSSRRSNSRDRRSKRSSSRDRHRSSRSYDRRDRSRSRNRSRSYHRRSRSRSQQRGKKSSHRH
ncbi:arginine/serine-rich protein PNISR isoform X2 [Chrysoperla carnea]|uniref:arginine/serine-rich protein PNISR isoform X2 n=1 Tax=Chrysoperla carnea TaxID=189513 RepID=UPI001D077A87|nr:arginine/serine-rich protein PNISR isoform X2 [Chrysoperla carnea]